MEPRPETIFYKRSHFVTHLPKAFLYSPSHYWLHQIEPGLWRAGITRFASRMLGEMVDHGFDATPGIAVQPGQILGFIEGFKAISDIYCVAVGEFVAANPLLPEKIAIVTKDCYGEGWLYMIRGSPDPNCVDVLGYQSILNKTIDKILEKQKASEIQ